MTHLTSTYSTLHRAIRDVGREARMDPYAARVLLAIYDRGGAALTDELEADLAEDGSALRRALLTLYGRSLATGVGADGGPRRKGVRSRVTLTAAGAELARQIIHDFAEAVA